MNLNLIGKAGNAVTKAAGTKGYGFHLVDGISNVATWVYQGMSGSVINTTGHLLYGGKTAADAFVKAGKLPGFITGVLIKVPLAIMTSSAALDDMRRIRETAGGQSGFYVSREAEDKTCMLSSAAALASATSLFRLRNLAPGKWINSNTGKLLSATPSLKGFGAVTGIAAAGLLAARSIYKWVNIDLPFNPTSGLAAISFGKPIMRVDNPESPYYLMSHTLEKSVNARMREDLEHGKAGEGIGKFLEEKIALPFTDFMMGSRVNLHS